MSRRYGRRCSIPALLLSALTPLVSSVALAAVPPNDKCPTAEIIPPAGPFPHLSTLVPDISQATTTGDPKPSCVDSYSRGIWYSFTPTKSAEYRISTCAPPTGTTVNDTALAVYTSSNSTCTGVMTEIFNGCSDDDCDKRSGVNVSLTGGTTYYIVASKWGTGFPAAGETAMQLEVTTVPDNDTCENAANLPFERTVTGWMTLATNNYEVSTSAPNCYSLPSPPDPVGQPASPSAANGRDVAYSFTAPEAGAYSFKAQYTTIGGNLIVHVASSCPTGAGPNTLTDCMGAADRNANTLDYYAAEEVSCVPLAAGQTVYVFVDEAEPTTDGARFTLEATACAIEAEPNDDTLQAAPLSCGLTGAIYPQFDEDFYSLGSPPAGTRVFAMVDGIAGNGNDFDMRITTETDTLEYDDADNSTPWGGACPNIAGSPLPGTPSFLKMNYFGWSKASEPYRLYSVMQPPGAGLGGSSATPETEPNDTIANASSAGNLFFSGNISTGGVAGDRDLFKFCADEGDLIYLGIDGDPLRDETALDSVIFLLDRDGTELLNWSDIANFSISTPSPNTLDGTTPRSPGESALYRATYTGLHYAGIRTDSNGAPYGTGDYLYSIALNCLNGEQAQTDLTLSMTDTPDPVGSDEALELKVDVQNQGPRTALEPHWTMTIPAKATLVNVSAAPGWTCDVTGNDIDCTTSCFPGGDLASFTVQLRTVICPVPGVMVHAATITSKTSDSNPTNDTAVEVTEVFDGKPCEDGDVCTAGDTCSNGVCVSGIANDCNDNNACTDDICLPNAGCAHTNNTNTCDDSNACTTADICVNGQCKGGPPLDCSDSDACTDDLCDAITGCYTELNSAPCEDGNPCTSSDTCNMGTCISGPPVVCNPQNDCQQGGVCDPATGACAYYLKPDGTSCNDGNACSLNDKCLGGACIDSTSTVCPQPPDDCHGSGVCNPMSGACEYTLIGSDLDGDGIGDKCDSDIDGDGISNDQETAWGLNPNSKDSDGDTIDDCTEACPENDGSCFDGKVCTVETPANTDGDDTIDALDSDSDDDGVSDALEAGDTDLATPPADTNDDGLPDYRDAQTTEGGTDITLTGGPFCGVKLGEKNGSTSSLWVMGLGLLALGARRRRR